MNNKIFTYLFLLKTKFILLNLFFICLFVQLINLLEISRIIESKNSNLFSIIYLSLLKIPTVIIETIPFVVIISTAFLYRNLIANNEIISMRNIGFSIIDIYKPIALSIFSVGIIVIIIINPISAVFEKKFDDLTSKDFSELYSIKVKNNELWIKNTIENKEKYFINIENIDFKNMEAQNIKILSTSEEKNFLYLAKKGKIIKKNFLLDEVIIFNIDNDIYDKKKLLNLSLNFNNENLIDSISNYKFVPFYKYKKHLDTLKRFNLYSNEVALHYLSEILKPFFLVIIGFTVMGYSGKFKRNENFFKILFISILIGFSLFLLKETITAIAISLSISFLITYITIFFVPLIIGLYFIINIEMN